MNGASNLCVRLGLRLGKVRLSISRGVLFPQNSAHHKAEVGRTFAQTPHEIREPLPTERDVQTHPIALGRECPLQVTSDSIQHLKLEAVLRDALVQRV